MDYTEGGFANADGGIGEDRLAYLLKEAVGRKPAREDPAVFVEHVLAEGTDRLFACGSPLGEVYVGVGTRGVRMVGRAESPEEFARRYRKRFGRLLSEGSDPKTRGMAQRVARALAGENVEVPVDLSGATPFQRRVLEVVKGIPRGEVRPYAWVAREAGSSNASRAVGTVMANNPLPLVVPCHRVVKNDGTTGGYAFGPKEKVHLLEGEGVPLEEIAGRPYLATPTTGIVCHAPCRNARRIRSENRRRFRSAVEAVEAGYRPCRVCRPLVPEAAW
jgi:methylated-DNA-[protein]-cysteine S-methyltransferase